MSNRQELAKSSTDAVLKFLSKGGQIEIVKSKKGPKQVTACHGSTKHCGRTNKFGVRI